MTKLIGPYELLKIYANSNNVLGVTLQPVGKSEGHKYVELDKIMQFPIRRDHYDRENGNEHFINGIESVMEYIETLPTIDAVPVRHGEWIEQWRTTDTRMLRCSECKMVFNVGNGREGNYCPNCGARMGEE